MGNLAGSHGDQAAWCELVHLVAACHLLPVALGLGQGRGALLLWVIMA